MKVHGFTDEITTCDCCGKRNLAGTFTVETDGGELLSYGSVCVNKVYGKKRGESIKAEAKQISAIKSLAWDEAVRKVAFGHFYSVMALAGGKSTNLNTKAEWQAVDAFGTWNGKGFDIIRSKAT